MALIVLLFHVINYYHHFAFLKIEISLVIHLLRSTPARILGHQSLGYAILLKIEVDQLLYLENN